MCCSIFVQYNFFYNFSASTTIKKGKNKNIQGIGPTIENVYQNGEIKITDNIKN